MELIKKLGTRLNKNGIKESWAVFWCDFCKREVERLLSDGKKCKSCGCFRYKLSGKSNTKHSESKTKLYAVWTMIKQRTLNLKNKSYKNYGGRDINICPEWANDYIVFRDWSLSNGYQEGLQINRINNNGNYCPENCNFVTAKEKSWNTRRIVLNMKIANEIRFLHATGNYTQKELAIKYSVSQGTISFIINKKQWKNINNVKYSTRFGWLP